MGGTKKRPHPTGLVTEAPGDQTKDEGAEEKTSVLYLNDELLPTEEEMEIIFRQVNKSRVFASNALTFAGLFVQCVINFSSQSQGHERSSSG